MKYFHFNYKFLCFRISSCVYKYRLPLLHKYWKYDYAGHVFEEKPLISSISNKTQEDKDPNTVKRIIHIKNVKPSGKDINHVKNIKKSASLIPNYRKFMSDKSDDRAFE